MKKIIGLLVAGVLSAGALIAIPAIVPAASSAGNPVVSTALSLVAPATADASTKKKKKKKKKASKKSKAKATKSEYKKIKRGMKIAKVRKIIGSKGKRTWYYESTSSDYRCDDGYYTDGYYEPTENWVEDGYWQDFYDDEGNWTGNEWVDTSHMETGETWVDGEWIDGECWDEDLTTIYTDYRWKNNKGGYVYVSFVNGHVDSKSWYS